MNLSTATTSLARSALFAFCGLVASASLANAQGPEIEGVERWDQLDIGLPTYDEPPELPDEILIDELHTVSSPTVIRVPAMGAEGQAQVSIEILEGDAEIYAYVEDSWQPFVEWAEIGPMAHLPIAVVPHGKVQFAILMQYGPPCLKHWQCTLIGFESIVPSINYNRCVYGCVFDQDQQPGCSGLTPGISLGLHSDTFFTECPDDLEFWTL